MATVYLNRSSAEFWRMTPRELVTLIDQWKAIEKNRDILRAYIASGGNPDELGAAENVAKSNAGLWSQI